MTVLASETLSAPAAAIAARERAVGVSRREAPFSSLERRQADDGSQSLVGHALVFDQLSEDLGGWREKIQRGAVRKALPRSDVRGLFNHNPDNILGRVSAGTLSVEEDSRGLAFELSPPDTDIGNRVAVAVERGDVTGCSFAFTVRSDVWEETDGELVRTIIELDELFDVGPVTYPAYPQTDISMRDVCSALGDETLLREIAWKIHRGEIDASASARALIDEELGKLDTVSPWVAQRAFRAVAREPELRGAIPGSRVSVVIEDSTPDAGEPAIRLAARRRREALRAHQIGKEAA